MCYMHNTYSSLQAEHNKNSLDSMLEISFAMNPYFSYAFTAH